MTFHDRFNRDGESAEHQRIFFSETIAEDKGMKTVNNIQSNFKYLIQYFLFRCGGRLSGTEDIMLEANEL